MARDEGGEKIDTGECGRKGTYIRRLTAKHKMGVDEELNQQPPGNDVETVRDTRMQLILQDEQKQNQENHIHRYVNPVVST